ARSDVGLAPARGFGRQARGALPGQLDAARERGVVAGDRGSLVETLVDHLLEEVAEAIGVPAGVRVEVEPELVGLRFVLARVAHADEAADRIAAGRSRHAVLEAVLLPARDPARDAERRGAREHAVLTIHALGDVARIDVPVLVRHHRGELVLGAARLQ